MILSRFFKPKWQNANPEARQKAVTALERNDPALAQLAREDQDPEVRRAALARLDDLDLLMERIQAETDPGTRQSALERYRALLAGQVENGPSLSVRLTRLEGGVDHEDLLFLLRHARDAQLRLALLPRLQDPAVLVELAVGDPAFEVQSEALTRLEAINHLEEVARLSRKRSKRIYRLVQERLEQHRRAAEALAGATALCEALEQFANDPQANPKDTRYQTLVRQWEALETPDSHLAQRVQEAQERMLARHQAISAEQAERRELQDLLDLSLARLRGKHTLDEEAEGLVAQLRQRLATESDDDHGEWEQRLQDLDHQERRLHRNHERVARLERVLADGERQLGAKRPIQEVGLEKLRRRWSALEHPESPDLTDQLQQQWASFAGRWKQRLEAQAQQREANLQELRQLVETLEQELTQGEVKQATDHQERLRALFRDDQLPPGARRELESRVQELNKTLGELRDWRRWGTHQARDHLCEAAEALATEETLDPPELARRVQALRTNWQRLDRNEGAAGRAAWERFNEACERAYQPCIAYFEAQAQERANNMEKREALCAELEAFHAETDWGSVQDWRSVDRFINERYQRWRRLGPVDRGARKAIDRRFDAIRKRLDPLLEQQRKQDLQRRRGLIDAVEALVDQPDLREAIEQTKQIQAQWSPLILASRREEQALWKTFRGACDRVFARRQAEQHAQDQERQTNLASKEALCAELESLSVAEEDLARSRGRLDEIQTEWKGLGPVPGAAHQAVERRLQQAIENFQQRQRELLREQEREALASLWRRHRLCTSLECLLEAPPEDAAERVRDARQVWGTLPRVKATLGENIRRRFQRVCQALDEEDQEADTAESLRQELMESLETKQQLCLRMEILAGAETPAEFSQARMAYQVQRLSASLGGGEGPPPGSDEEADSVQEQWCLSGVLPSDHCEALEQRFQIALGALEAKPSADRTTTG